MHGINGIHRLVRHLPQPLDDALGAADGQRAVDFPRLRDSRVADGIVGGVDNQHGFPAVAALDVLGEARRNRQRRQRPAAFKLRVHLLLRIRMGNNREFFRIRVALDEGSGHLALILVENRQRNMADELVSISRPENEGEEKRQEQENRKLWQFPPAHLAKFFPGNPPNGHDATPSPNSRNRIPGRSAGELTCIFTLKLMMSASLPRSLVARWVANSDFRLMSVMTPSTSVVPSRPLRRTDWCSR